MCVSTFQYLEYTVIPHSIIHALQLQEETKHSNACATHITQTSEIPKTGENLLLVLLLLPTRQDFFLPFVEEMNILEADPRNIRD